MSGRRSLGTGVVADPMGRANGSTPPAPVIKTDTLTFDDLGYPGWAMTVRTNPSAQQYDEVLDADDATLWEKFAVVVVGWNFVDDAGKPLPQPTGESLGRVIPWDIRRVLIARYFDLFKVKADAPKESSDNSTSTSTKEQ